MECRRPWRPSDHLTLIDPSIYTQCIMDEYAPEEESALKLRAVGRVQEGVRATVRACLLMCVSMVMVVKVSLSLSRWCRSTGRLALDRRRWDFLSTPPTTTVKERLTPLTNATNTQVSNPEEGAVWDGYLTAAEQEVSLPEDDYGLYRICVHNGGACFAAGLLPWLLLCDGWILPWD